MKKFTPFILSAGLIILLINVRTPAESFDQKVEQLLAQLTLEEKVTLFTEIHILQRRGVRAWGFRGCIFLTYPTGFG